MPRLPSTRIILASFVLLFCYAAALGAQAETLGQDNNPYTQCLNLPIREWHNEAKPVKAIVVAMHGVTLHGGCYELLGQHLAAQGYMVLSPDIRGFGRWAHGDFSHMAHNHVNYIRSNQDLNEILNLVHCQYPDRKIYCLGESLGANLAIYLAAMYPTRVNGIILASPCVKRFQHVCPRSLFDVTKGIIDPFKEVSLKPYVSRYLSDDDRVTEEYMDDPLVRKRMKGYEAVWSLIANDCSLRKMRELQQNLPVLVLSGAKDEIYKSSAVPDFVDRLSTHQKTLFIAPDKGHILLETTYIQPAILHTIDSWLEQTVNGPAASPPVGTVANIGITR